MEVSVPTVPCIMPQEIDFGHPFALVEKFNEENESGRSLIQFMKVEAEKLRQQFVPDFFDPNREELMEYFDSSNSQNLMKNTLEMIWSSQFAPDEDILKKFDHLMEMMKEAIAKLQDFAHRVGEMSMLMKVVKYCFGFEMRRQLKEMHKLLDLIEAGSDQLWKQDFGGSNPSAEEERCLNMLNNVERNAIGEELRELLLKRRLKAYRDNRSQALSASNSMRNQLLEIRKILAWRPWLSNDFDKIKRGICSIGRCGLHAIRLAIIVNKIRVGEKLNLDDDALFRVVDDFLRYNS